MNQPSCLQPFGPCRTNPAVQERTNLGPWRGRAGGFTLLELIVVLAVVAISFTLGLPALQKMAQRERLLSVARGISAQLAIARQEAVKRGVPVVVEPNWSEERILIFANVDGDDELEFTDDGDTVKGPTEDYLLSATELTQTKNPAVFFQGPGDASPGGPNTLDGLTARPSAPTERLFVFEPDGSIRDVGAIRISDAIGNIIEVRVSPKSTGRTTLRKWDSAASTFYEQGHDPVTGKSLWRWG